MQGVEKVRKITFLKVFLIVRNCEEFCQELSCFVGNCKESFISLSR